jgi:hypothetical protein
LAKYVKNGFWDGMSIFRLNVFMGFVPSEKLTETGEDAVALVVVCAMILSTMAPAPASLAPELVMGTEMINVLPAPSPPVPLCHTMSSASALDPLYVCNDPLYISILDGVYDMPLYLTLI